MKPNDILLSRLGIDRSVAYDLALVVHAANGKSVLSVLGALERVERARAELLELSHALGLEVKSVGHNKIIFEGSGQISFISPSPTATRGIRCDILDGAALLPSDIVAPLISTGTEVW